MSTSHLARVTKHKKPRHQLYQHGFNRHNGCWLDGDWITVPAEEFEERKKAHLALYRNALKSKAKQSHRGKAIPLEALTPAQRQAWEHYSGNITFNMRYENGWIGLLGVQMAGLGPQPKQIEWLKEQGGLLIPIVSNPDGTIENMREVYDFPDELWDVDTEAVDVWKIGVRQNIQRERDMWLGMLGECQQDAPSVPGTIMGQNYQQFSASMVISGLTTQEERILQQEWNLKVGKDDPYDDVEDERAWYATMREKMAAVWSEEEIEQALAVKRESHNSCARANLDNSNGSSWSFVLPVFNVDGTHPPLGPRDEPWSRTS